MSASHLVNMHQFPPTPSPSEPSPSQANGSAILQPHQGLPTSDRKTRTAFPVSVIKADLPITPPADDPVALAAVMNPENTQRTQRGRRSVSVYPGGAYKEAVHIAPRKYTDPSPRPFVNSAASSSFTNTSPPVYTADATYSGDFTTESEADSQEPTLSFATTSTAESTNGTPSHRGAYTLEREDGKSVSEGEPRIRLRSTAGRSTAYSSADSSGSYSYHNGYENQVFHPHPPPLPSLPSGIHNHQIGLGITAPVTHAHAASPSPQSASFSHRPWQSDLTHRGRSDSQSTSLTAESNTTHDSASGDTSEDYADYDYMGHLPWDDDPQAAAVNLVDQGRERILDMAQLEAAGGVHGLTIEYIVSLEGVTHLLLPMCDAAISVVLDVLLEILAPTLVVLDLSNIGLQYLPEAIGVCHSLEELNISGNHLRSLPPFIGNLAHLRMFLLDDCTLQSLPIEMARLAELHTLCVRRNRLVSLPSWLTILHKLETLRIDENPFAAEWLPIIAPILARTPRSKPEGYHPESSEDHIGMRHLASAASLASSTTSSSIRSKAGVTSSPSVHSEQAMSPPVSATPSMQQLPSLAPISEDSPSAAIDLSPVIAINGITPPMTFQRPVVKQDSSKSSMRSAFSGTSSTPTPSTFGHGLSTSRSSVLNAPSSSRKLLDIASDSTPRGSVVESPETSASNSTKSGKWGFLRKMSMHRLKSSDKLSLSSSVSSNVKAMPTLHHTNSDPPQSALPQRPNFRSAFSAMTLPTRSVPPTEEFGSLGFSTPIGTPLGGLPSSSSLYGGRGNPTGSRGKRRSFLPIDGPPSIKVAIPSVSPFMPVTTMFEVAPEVDTNAAYEGTEELLEPAPIGTPAVPATPSSLSLATPLEPPRTTFEYDEHYATGLESIKSYLRDLFDLSRSPIQAYGGFEVVNGVESTTEQDNTAAPDTSRIISEARRARPLTLESSTASASVSADESTEAVVETSVSSKKFKDDRTKRTRIMREIYETEKTYVRGLGELVTIYVRPSSHPISKTSQETVIPAADRKVVFGSIESILTIHRDNLLPALEEAIRPLIEKGDDEEGLLSENTAHHMGDVFRTYITYMKQYSNYINNFDNALSRMKTWTTYPSMSPFGSKPSSPNPISAAAIGAGLSAISLPLTDTAPGMSQQVSSAQRRRVNAFIKRCREHPMHSQISLESYLLLPVQRVPRYKLLLEDLAMCTPPRSNGREQDDLDDCIKKISALASLMNEEKREAESRIRLLHWQQRITTKGPSPLVQPHRRLILDGTLHLIRLVKKNSVFVEVDNTVMTDGESTIMPSKSIVPVDFIKPEPMNSPVILILCSDLLVLAVHRTGDGTDGGIELYNVLRLATIRAPASIINGQILRVVDHKSIYYFRAESHAECLQWCRAINTARSR